MTSQMTIGKKLFLGFGAALVLTITLGGNGHVGHRQPGRQRGRSDEYNRQEAVPGRRHRYESFRCDRRGTRRCGPGLHEGPGYSGAIQPGLPQSSDDVEKEHG